MKTKSINIFNLFLSIYFVICYSFFYNQYLKIVVINKTSYSNIDYFIRDNLFLIILFVVILFSILSNLIYIIEYWIHTTKQEIKIKKYIGYRKKEIVVEYYLKYILSFFIVYIIAVLLSIFFLKIFELPIFYPTMFSGIILMVLITAILIIMLVFSLNNLEKGTIGKFKVYKKFIMIFQLSISLLLIFVALNIFQEINKEISPYKNYRDMNDSWVFSANEYDPYQMKDEYIKSRGNIIEKISQIYSKYSDNMLVYFSESFINENIGKVVYANEAVFDINLMNTEIFEKYIDSTETPVILNNQFSDKYSEGDIIQGKRTNYVVAKILDKNEVMELLGPNDYDSRSSNQFAFALFNEMNLQSFNAIDNTNFIDTLFFQNINDNEKDSLRTFINEDGIEYSAYSMKEIQKDYYNQKTVLFIGYIIVGLVNLLFSVIGLIYILLLEINVRALDYSIMKLVGYSSKQIYLRYMLLIFFVFAISLLNSLAISYYTLGFSNIVLIIVLLLILIILMIISYLAMITIKNINPVLEIGGENV